MRRARVPRRGAAPRPRAQDIVFFGEPLPAHFWPSVDADFQQCDLLLVIGTSLTVMPFAGLVRNVGARVPRVLVNREAAGGKLLVLASEEEARAADDEEEERGDDDVGAPHGDAPDGGSPIRRDFALLGDLQVTVRSLTRLAGWHDELRTLVRAQRARARDEAAGGGGAAPVAAARSVGALADALAGEMSKLAV